MLYIHKLADLNIKSAEIESVPLVRTLNMNHVFPFTNQNVQGCFSECLASANDISLIDQSIQRLEPTITKITQIMSLQSPIHEPVNLKRAIQSLQSLILPLTNNVDYAIKMLALQEAFFANAAFLLNSIPTLRSNDEKTKVNSEISKYFESVLLNTGFVFNYTGLVHEGHTSLVHDLIGCFGKGYLFHFSLEDELKKATFEEIKQRIPTEMLQENEEIASSIALIEKGVQAAYDMNLRMVQFAVMFYCCIKLARNQI
jgi:hypothetical protein